MPTVPGHVDITGHRPIPCVYSYQQALYDVLAAVPTDQRTCRLGELPEDIIKRDQVIKGWHLHNIDVTYQGARQKLLFDFYTGENCAVDTDNMSVVRITRPGSPEREDVTLPEAKKQRVGVAYFNRAFIARELARLKERGLYAFPSERLIRFEYRVLAENFPDDPNFRHLSFPKDIFHDGIFARPGFETFNTLGFLVDLDPA